MKWHASCVNEVKIFWSELYIHVSLLLWRRVDVSPIDVLQVLEYKDEDQYMNMNALSILLFMQNRVYISFNNTKSWWYITVLNKRETSYPGNRTSSHKWVECYKCTYFLLHLLCDVLHVQSAGRLTCFITFKHGHPFYLCLKREENSKTCAEHHRTYLHTGTFTSCFMSDRVDWRTGDVQSH